MSFIKRILASLEARLNQPKISVWRTIYFNFRLIELKHAVKFPVFIYGRVRFFGLNGKIYISSDDIKRGMIKIGINGDSFSLFDHSGYIQLASRDSYIVFEGPCRIALNTKIRVAAGVLTFGEYVRIGSDTRIICNGNDITIGKMTGITFSCNIMNSSFHYMYDCNKGCYKNRSSKITIGSYCWIGNQTTIIGHAKIPDYSTVGTGSLVNKDLINGNQDIKYPLIAGRPAKIIYSGVKRVFSPTTEVEVSKIFGTIENRNKDIIESYELPDNPFDIKVEL